MNNKIQFYSIKNSRWLAAWTNQFCSSNVLNAANIRKVRGATVGLLLRMLLAGPFCGFRIWNQAGGGLEGPGRDAFYRFLSHPSYNWRRLLLEASLRLAKELNRLTDPRTDRVLILDESPYKRARSKCVEYLGSQYDSSSGRYYRGFRMLTLGWSDGNSFIPQQMELLTNRSADKRIGPEPDLDGYTLGASRSKTACQKTTEVAVKMVARKRSNSEGPVIGSMTVKMLSGPMLRVVFIRDQYNPDQWMGLASTDTEITPDRVCRIYAKRCAIEVFFKQIKQHLGLVSELQVRSYSACIAHTSIVFLRYMMLAYYQWQQADERTIPGLFYGVCEQLQALPVACCLQIILLEWACQASTSNSQLFEAACLLCGVAGQLLENMNDNSIVFKRLNYNCES